MARNPKKKKDEAIEELPHLTPEGSAHRYRHGTIGIFKRYGLLRFGASANARPFAIGL